LLIKYLKEFNFYFIMHGNDYARILSICQNFVNTNVVHWLIKKCYVLGIWPCLSTRDSLLLIFCPWEIQPSKKSFALKFELKRSLGGPLSKLRATPPFSINFRCQIKNQVSDYRLLWASSFSGLMMLNLYISVNPEYMLNYSLPCSCS
jgi:hypothetical protein